ncbi:MAG: hypothetical protein IPM61_15790 [Chlorobi bacterium]|nr:MAG: hypothetical protein UZ07_CHB004001145 [Chlorobi bacterium OLB7]MBK8912771.1 hypothetical protein [Chlorobiota bacterium]MBX7218043.1 hypothetical protein [Candidatus Kapabacteria bacterium]
MSTAPLILLSVGLLLIGGCCAMLRQSAPQLMLGQVLMTIGAAAILLHLLASFRPSIVWAGLPLCVLLVAGIGLFRHVVADRASQRPFSETESQNH